MLYDPRKEISGYAFPSQSRQLGYRYKETLPLLRYLQKTDTWKNGICETSYFVEEGKITIWSASPQVVGTHYCDPICRLTFDFDQDYLVLRKVSLIDGFWEEAEDVIAELEKSSGLVRIE